MQVADFQQVWASSVLVYKDLADVQELIKIKHLDARFAERLHTFVREKLVELHRAAIASDESSE